MVMSDRRFSVVATKELARLLCLDGQLGSNGEIRFGEILLRVDVSRKRARIDYGFMVEDGDVDSSLLMGLAYVPPWDVARELASLEVSTAGLREYRSKVYWLLSGCREDLPVRNGLQREYFLSRVLPCAAEWFKQRSIGD